MLTFKEIKTKKFYYNNLFYDFIFNFDKVADHFFYNYLRKEDFFKSADYVISGQKKAAEDEIIKSLKDYNSSCGCLPETLSNIEKLKNGAFIVIAGQQPGLFTGPIFNIYKIITVIKLSNFLSSILKKDVVPVFWNASDDSNTGQIDSTYFFSGTEIQELKIPLQEDRRISDILLDAEIVKNAVKKITSGLPATENTTVVRKFMDDVVGVFKSAGYLRPNYLFSCTVLKLFSKYGLVMVDPCLGPLKNIAVEYAEFDMDNSERIKNSLKKESMCLSERGYHNQIDYLDDSLNFFFVENGVRRKIYKKGNNIFEYKDDMFTKEELMDKISKDPGIISLNVILRCIFQDSVLPNICTVCGPGEVSYIAQLKGVYNIFDKRTGIIYPRISATVIEKSIDSAILKLNLNFDDLEYDYNYLKRVTFKSSANIDLEKILEDFRNDIFLKTGNLKKYLEKNELNMGSAFNRIDENIAREIDKLSKKIINQHLQKNEIALNQLKKIYLNFFPDNMLQERKINVFNYINKYGFKLIDNLINGLGITGYYHRFIYIDH